MPPVSPAVSTSLTSRGLVATVPWRVPDHTRVPHWSSPWEPAERCGGPTGRRVRGALYRRAERCVLRSTLAVVPNSHGRSPAPPSSPTPPPQPPPSDSQSNSAVSGSSFSPPYSNHRSAARQGWRPPQHASQRAGRTPADHPVCMRACRKSSRPSLCTRQSTSRCRSLLVQYVREELTDAKVGTRLTTVSAAHPESRITTNGFCSDGCCRPRPPAQGGPWRGLQPARRG